MSQPLSRIMKPLVYTNILRHNNLVRWCSSTPIYPFMLIDHLLKVGGSSSDGNNAISRRSGSEGENEIIIKNTYLAGEVRNAMTSGFIKQSGVIIHMKGKNSLYDMDNVRLNIYYKPTDPKSKSVSVHLPPLPKGSQIQNLAMSSLPDLGNDDWVVAIKFSVSRLMLYRHKELRWIDIDTTYGPICPYSSLMYSNKDKTFYTPTPGGNWLCSFGLDYDKEEDEAEYDFNIWKTDFHQYMVYELEQMNSYTRTDHLVESPSGEQFLISWYYGDDFESDKVVQKTKRFLVFTRDKDRMHYTENIGDLCIFLGYGEAVCVPASSSPGLKPNCIYFVGHNFGVYDITTQTCTLFYTENGPLKAYDFPYWPHPFYLTPN